MEATLQYSSSLLVGQYFKTILAWPQSLLIMETFNCGRQVAYQNGQIMSTKIFQKYLQKSEYCNI